jgi:syntaxin 6
MIIEQQDRTLDSISGVIGTLREQAGVIGHEVLDQVRCALPLCSHTGCVDAMYSMLTHLENDVDRSESRLAQANKRMQHFIHENSSASSAEA